MHTKVTVHYSPALLLFDDYMFMENILVKISCCMYSCYMNKVPCVDCRICSKDGFEGDSTPLLLCPVLSFPMSDLH